MPNRVLLIFITLLLGIGSASAQKYPERSLVRKGNRDFAKERYDRSIERYTQALEAAPENFEAAYNLGGALYRTEKYEEAAKTLERIAACLENESPEVVIDEQVRRAAERSIRRMIEIG